MAKAKEVVKKPKEEAKEKTKEVMEKIDAKVGKKEKKSKSELKKELLDEARQRELETEQLLKNADIEDITSSCYFEMDNYIGMAKLGASYGAIIEGPGGCGKSYRVISHLRDCNYAYTDSFTTPQALYTWMYKNRDNDVLVVDDVHGFLSNPKVLSFLKGGLWNVGDKKNRIIHYMTSKPLQDDEGRYVPNSFVLNARMIIITNKLKQKDPHLEAVLTRVNYCKIEIPFEELMRIMEQVAKKDYPELSYDERMEIFYFLREKASVATENLSIRTLIKCFQQKVYGKMIGKPDQWKTIAVLHLLKEDPALVVVDELLRDNSFKREEDRIKVFISRTGSSRATYYRLRDRLGTMGDKGE